MRQALRMLLERRSYLVVEVETGEQLLEHLAKEAPPLCVLLDLHLEGISGMEARQAMGDCPFPVILMTGDTSAAELVGAGLFKAMLFKPLDWMALCGILKEIDQQPDAKACP